MAANSLYPAFVQVHYHSNFGKHVMTIPTRDYIPPAAGHPSGSYIAWDTSTRDAEDMINDLFTAVIAITESVVTFDYTIFFKYPALPPATPQPLAIFNQNVSGTVAPSGKNGAIENVYTFFDTGFNTFKWYLLDADATFSLVPQHFSDLDAAHQAVVAELTESDQAWSSRAGFKPDVLRSVISKPNDKLRKEYHLS
jgi:hypothetical protein